MQSTRTLALQGGEHVRLIIQPAVQDYDILELIAVENRLGRQSHVRAENRNG